METTTNYELKKYQSGDLFNPLTVNNPNLDDIDADMKAISDRAIGRATELVSQGVHAITLLDTNCKTFKFVATGNYLTGETFTVNGIQANAYTPSGSALTSNAFVTGSVVLGSLNEDGTAITFYVTGSAVADDSLKLGGELPSYYATQSDMTSAKTDITNLKNQAGNTSIVGIGDGTLSGAVSFLNNKQINFGLENESIFNSTIPTNLNKPLTDFDFISVTAYGSQWGAEYENTVLIPTSILLNGKSSGLYIGGTTTILINISRVDNNTLLFRYSSGTQTITFTDIRGYKIK